MTYYGVNNSSQYGSNFSSVLADAPPPLDDTFEEDDDFVLTNKGTKGKQDSKTAEHNDTSQRCQGNDEADDFGDFEAFANFNKIKHKEIEENNPAKPADWFEPSNVEHDVSWPDHFKNQVISSAGSEFMSGGDQRITSDDDFADFEGFAECTSVNNIQGKEKVVSSKNDGSIARGKYKCENHETRNGSDSQIPQQVSSTKDINEVDFGAFSVVENDSSDLGAEFCPSNGATNNYQQQKESFDHAVNIKQTSCELQKDRNKSSDFAVPKDTAGHEESPEKLSDDDFGDFNTAEVNFENIDTEVQFNSYKNEVELPSVDPKITRGITEANAVNRTVVSIVGDCSTQIRESKKTEVDLHNQDLCSDYLSNKSNHDEFSTNAAVEGSTMEREKISYNGEDDFGCLNGYHGNSKHLRNDHSSEFASSSEQEEKKPVETAETNFSAASSQVQNDKGNPLGSNQADLDELGSLKSHTKSNEIRNLSKHDASELQSERKTSGTEKHGVSANAAKSTSEEQEDFGAFDSADKARDKEQQDLSDFSMSPSPSRESEQECARNDAEFKPNSPLECLDSTEHIDFDSGDTGQVETNREVKVMNATDAEGIAESNENDDFGDFSPFDSQPEGSDQHKSERGDSRELKAANAPESLESNEHDDFGDFSTFDSQPEGSDQHKAESGDSRELKAANAPESLERSEHDDFGDFSTFDSQPEGSDQHKAERVDSGELKAANAPENLESNEHDDFGDFSTFDSQPEGFIQHKAENGDFEAFKTTTPIQSTRSSETNDFGDFSTFSSAEDQSNKTKPDSWIDSSRFRTSDNSSFGGFADFSSSQASEGFTGAQTQSIRRTDVSIAPQSAASNLAGKHRPRTLEKVLYATCL